MATSYTDGNILADSFTADIASQTYVFNNASFTVPAVEAERNDETGVLAAKRSLQDLGRITMTAEVQISASALNQQLQFEEFLVPASVHYDGVETQYVVETESPSITVNESRVRSITARRTITQPA